MRLRVMEARLPQVPPRKPSLLKTCSDMCHSILMDLTIQKILKTPTNLPLANTLTLYLLCDLPKCCSAARAQLLSHPSNLSVHTLSDEDFPPYSPSSHLAVLQNFISFFVFSMKHRARTSSAMFNKITKHAFYNEMLDR